MPHSRQFTSTPRCSPISICIRLDFAMDHSEPERMGRDEVEPSRRNRGDEGRKRARLACAACKVKKTKCDGCTPCSECLRRKQPADCIYSSRKDKSRRSKQLSRSRLSRSSSGADGNHRNDLGLFPDEQNEVILNTNTKHLPSPSQADILRKLLDHLDFGNPDVQASIRHFLEDKESKAHQSLPIEETTPANDERAIEGAYISQLLPDKLGKLYYIGEAGFLNFLEQIRLWVSAKEKALGVKSTKIADVFVQGGFRSYVTGPLSLDQFSHQGSEALMWFDKEEMCRLLKYADEGSPIGGLYFGRSECEEWIKTIGTGDITNNQSHIISTIVLYLVFALGLLYGPRDAMSGVPENRAHNLLEMANRLRKESLNEDDGGISIVQVYALTALTNLALVKRQACWIQLGIYKF